jgi:hypothetical protein
MSETTRTVREVYYAMASLGIDPADAASDPRVKFLGNSMVASIETFGEDSLHPTEIDNPKIDRSKE